MAQTDTTVDLEMTTDAVWSRETKDDRIGQTPAKGTLDSCFLDTSKLIDFPPGLESTDKMPGGIKENIYFVIQNEKNQNKRKLVLKVFLDGCSCGFQPLVGPQNHTICCTKIEICRKLILAGEILFSHKV